jgi:hypothetical protein
LSLVAELLRCGDDAVTTQGKAPPRLESIRDQSYVQEGSMLRAIKDAIRVLMTVAEALA